VAGTLQSAREASSDTRRPAGDEIDRRQHGCDEHDEDALGVRTTIGSADITLDLFAHLLSSSGLPGRWSGPSARRGASLPDAIRPLKYGSKYDDRIAVLTAATDPNDRPPLVG